MDFAYNINDLEAFINGLRVSFDQLDKAEVEESNGFQYRLSKVISNIRMKQREISEQEPSFNADLSREGMKRVLSKQLEQMKTFLQNGNMNGNKRSELLLKIKTLTERLENS